jgi:hypothetical protein
MEKVKFDGNVKRVNIVTENPGTEDAKLKAQILFEFSPTDVGLERIGELLKFQEQIVNVVIELSQMELPMQATGGKR